MSAQSVRMHLSGTECNSVDSLVGALRGATKSIDATVYKFKSGKVLDALEKAMRRGIKVRLVVDNWQVYKIKKGKPVALKKRSKTLKIAKRGAMIKTWSAEKLHAKFVIVDNKQVLTGSYNWTNSADGKNTELLMYFSGPTSVQTFRELFEELWFKADDFDLVGQNQRSASSLTM